MASHHEPFKALGPIEWNDVPQDSLEDFLGDMLSQSQIIVDSIPTPITAAGPPTSTGRVRAKTESALAYPNVQRSLSLRRTQASAGQSALLQKEWKEVKTNPRDNPLGITVYKLAGKDGKGAWFARRSLHEGLTFAQWKSGLQREFAESMKVQGSPGSGNIRGIGADRNVEHHLVEDAGQLDVFQLSAQFPGPTAPRDFITLLLTSDFSHLQPDRRQHQPPLRQYMVVSKPCVHPDCPPRQGIIRGQYESVEIIREVPVDNANIADKRSQSSADLISTSAERGGDASSSSAEAPRAVEWLMVTRSDPGGSVPRFLIEKGTPPGIIGDAGKFVNWVSSTISRDGTPHSAEEASPPGDGDAALSNVKSNNSNNNRSNAAQRNSVGNIIPTFQTTSAIDHRLQQQQQSQSYTEVDEYGYSQWIPSSTGLYGIISGAFGVATTLTSGLRSQFSNPLSLNSSQESLAGSQAIPEQDEEDDAKSRSDASSIRSFASALSRSVTGEKPVPTADAIGSIAGSNNSDESKAQTLPPKDREYQKLMDRQQKLERTFSIRQKQMKTKLLGDKERDVTSQAKMREKHDRELAKQEAKYQREMRKLEEKRESEERKAERKKKKVAERQEKSNLTLELEKVRAEKDMALRQIELLRDQVGELQAQNTMLVAKLGRIGGMNRDDSASSKAASIKS